MLPTGHLKVRDRSSLYPCEGTLADALLAMPKVHTAVVRLRVTSTRQLKQQLMFFYLRHAVVQ